MPEPTPLLETTALRYAARDLPQPETEAFEARLAGDQAARDALAEAIRLSAAALHQDSPAPRSSLRTSIRQRLVYRSQPLLWSGLGAGIVSVAALIAVSLADRSAARTTAIVLPPDPAPTDQPLDSKPPTTPVAVRDEFTAAEHAAPESHDDLLRAAEIWAELSTADHVEKTHDDEARLQSRLKNLRPVSGIDAREP